jgi:hypothetical protein
MKTDERPVFLAGANLGEVRHVCAFFDSRDDEYRVTLPFIKDGLECGHKTIHIVDPSLRDDHLQRLASAGIDIAAGQKSGQIAVADWSQTFFVERPFNPDRQLALLDQALRAGREQGFPISRYVGHSEWALQEGGSIELLLELEAKTNEMWPRYADTLICCYDLARFDAETVVNALRTHPVVIIGGILHHNPFYVQPDVFLREVHERRSKRLAASTA